MRLKPIIMIVLALVFGASAILVGNSWIAGQTARQAPVAGPAPAAPPTATIVVASAPLRYGDEIGSVKLKQIPWPSTALPEGAFATVEEATRGGKRFALLPIEPNEPVLQSKITGPGARASVSTLIGENLGAVTIQVDEVVGLAGLVLPGDRVDVFLTQRQSGEDGGNTFNDRVLKNVRVLAVGQTADVKLDKPSVVRAVTIEVDAEGAQKVAIAGRLGSLSLMLRKAGEMNELGVRRLTAADLPENASGSGAGDAVSVKVTRGTKLSTYSVPRSPDGAFPADPTYATGNTRSGFQRREAVAQPPEEPAEP
ncbi:MAG TPA: Flp pilus assembly protein CpaB [Microvirga sp.]|nr:Flp pilus assembly protein CpaB [Microvirga sp.]